MTAPTNDQLSVLCERLKVLAQEAREASIALAAENKVLREATDRADYLIDRLWKCHVGTPVRDLDEAMSAYDTARAALNPETDHG